jgi:ribosomal protein L19
MPRPTQHKNKALLNLIDSEERKSIEKGREYEVPNYRSGDVMQVTLFNSLSQGTFNTFTGVVFANKMRNNLRSSFTMHTTVESTPTSISFKTFSPMVAKIEMVQFGSNKLRKKMNNIPYDNLSKNRMLEPVQKGRGYKARGEAGGKKKSDFKVGQTEKGRA